MYNMFFEEKLNILNKIVSAKALSRNYAKTILKITQAGVNKTGTTR